MLFCFSLRYLRKFCLCTRSKILLLLLTSLQLVHVIPLRVVYLAPLLIPASQVMWCIYRNDVWYRFAAQIDKSYYYISWVVLSNPRLQLFYSGAACGSLTGGCACAATVVTIRFIYWNTYYY